MVENVDSFSNGDLKQDALVRTLIKLQSLGVDATKNTIVVLDQHPAIAINSYRWSRVDAMRSRLGRGKRMSPVPMHLSRMLREPAAKSHAFEDAESRACIGDLLVNGTATVSARYMQEVIRAMVEVQLLKEQGILRVPDTLRQRIHRLRKKTGLALDIGQL